MQIENGSTYLIVLEIIVYNHMLIFINFHVNSMNIEI